MRVGDGKVGLDLAAGVSGRCQLGVAAIDIRS